MKRFLSLRVSVADAHCAKNIMIRAMVIALLCNVLLLFYSPSFAETMMDNKPALRLNPFEPGYRLERFKQKIDYDTAIKNEQRDGLVDIDFMKLKVPMFATEWPDEGGWTVQKNAYSYFNWRMKTSYAAADITATVHENYGGAKQWFISKAEATNMMELPWVACAKKIGTVCAQSKDRRLIFFAYKNVMIEITRLSYEPEPGHEDFAEIMAEWLFDALKAAPLRPMPR
jgi:hypothetical protein